MVCQGESDTLDSVSPTWRSHSSGSVALLIDVDLGYNRLLFLAMSVRANHVPSIVCYDLCQSRIFAHA